ncbi:MAG: hypothetical protein HRU46_04060, partial [Verrucomicrobiales bacterium]|nr:hypothetical protein [Verrucomicrobiales bacterium]
MKQVCIIVWIASIVLTGVSQESVPERDLDPDKAADFKLLAEQRQQREVEAPHQQQLVALKAKYQLAVERAYQAA